jgi:hypothetical protein
MGKFNYRAKSIVTAAQWRGDNLDEMKDLLKDVIDGDEEGPYVYADWIEPFYYASAKIDNPGYFMLKTEWDEFDPGVWIVVYEDGEIEGMSDEQFNKMFEKA